MTLVVAIGFVVLTVRRGSLTLAGAVAAAGLGITVVLVSGARWLLPLFAFFLGSVLLERLLPSSAEATDRKDKQPRDAVQVLCNGGVYVLVLCLPLPKELALVAMAVATSDTWASQVGKYFRQPTFDILRWRPVPVGLSGGVSPAGHLGGAAGAGLIGVLGGVLLPTYAFLPFLYITGFGFVGMLVDSLLGAGLQARYRELPTGRLTDRSGPGNQLVSGLPYITNDVVNLLSILLTVTLAYLTPL